MPAHNTDVVVWQVETGFMVTVCVAKKGVCRVVVLEGLQGSTRVEELLVCCGFGMLERAEIIVRCNAQVLKAEATLMEVGVAAGGVVHVCVGKCGGMPTDADPDVEEIFAFPGTEQAGPGSPEQGLAELLVQDARLTREVLAMAHDAGPESEDTWTIMMEVRSAAKAEGVHSQK